MTPARHLSKIFNPLDPLSLVWVSRRDETPATPAVAECRAALDAALEEAKRVRENSKRTMAAFEEAMKQVIRDVEQRVREEKTASPQTPADPAPTKILSPASQLMPQRKA